MDGVGTWELVNKYVCWTQLKMIFLLNEGRELQVNDSRFTRLDM